MKCEAKHCNQEAARVPFLRLEPKQPVTEHRYCLWCWLKARGQ